MQAAIRLIVTNRSFTLIALLIVVIAAWIKLPEVRVSQYPVVELPTLTIYVTLPGASALEIEQRVVRPIQEKLQNLRNLDEVISDIYNGYAWITVTFDYGIDVDDEYVAINSRINSIVSKFPAGTEVEVQKRSPVDFIVSFVLGISSPSASRDELLGAAETLSQRLRRLRSLEDVEKILPEQEVEINLDLARMGRALVDVSAIERAIRGNNQYLPTGVFEVGDKAISVLAFDGGYEDLAGLRATMIINDQGKAMALKDLATVRFADQRGTTTPRARGAPAVFVTMKLSEHANIFAARREIAATLDEIDWPADISVDWLFDAEAGVRSKLKELGSNILQGVAILTVVLLLAVGYRSALIISAVLPAALFLSLIGLAFTDYGIQEISLAGFIIALGLIVDNGIVVTENAYKLNHYRGYSKEESAIVGTSSVLMPLLSATATTALAFAPLYLLTTTTGLFLHSLVAVIWLCLGASLLAAVVLSSILIARIGTDAKVRYLPSIPSFLIALIPFRDRYYRSTLAFFVRHPLLLLGGVLLLLAVTAVAVSRLPVIVFPDSEDPYFTVDIVAPLDRSETFVAGLTVEISEFVAAHQDVVSCASVQGGSFPLVSTGASRVPVRRNNSQLFCAVDFRNAKRLNALLRELNAQLRRYDTLADVRAASFAVGSGAALADVEIHLVGSRVEQLRTAAAGLERYLLAAGIEGIDAIESEANSRHFALSIAFDERRASALGVNRRNVDDILVMAMYGKEIDQLRALNGEEYPIVLRTEVDTEDPLNVFDRILVTASNGAGVPLSQVVKVTFAADEFDITHREFEPRVGIDVYAVDDYDIAKLTAAVRSAAQAYELPEGIRLNFDGKLAEQANEFGGMGKYVGIITLIVLGILVLQFGSLAQPLIVCAAIPLSFIGAFLLLYFTGQPISFLAFIGLTSLMGIVINNSILLVDEGNRLRDLNPDKDMGAVAIDAGINRFMPILLTSLTSMAGLLPLALGDSMFKALAIVVIGGLGTSTFFTLLCVPVLYAYVTRQGMDSPTLTANWSGRSSLGEKV